MEKTLSNLNFPDLEEVIKLSHKELSKIGFRHVSDLPDEEDEEMLTGKSYWYFTGKKYLTVSTPEYALNGMVVSFYDESGQREKKDVYCINDLNSFINKYVL